MKFGFVIDNRKCIGCHACTVACKSEHDVPVGVNRTWVKQIEKGSYPNTRRVFSVLRCNHCTDAPCVSICPTQALYTRDDGIVDFNNDRCIGCKSCMQACPYDALYIDPETNTAAKCNYCAHRVDIGLEPACVNVCPEHAIISGDMEDPESEIAQLISGEQVSTRKAEKGTMPNVFYINGDESSLNPSATERSESYIWSSQHTGVGHFSKYAEKLTEGKDLFEMMEDLKGPMTEDKITSYSGRGKKTQVQGIMESANAKRVYDTPDKGVLWAWEVSAYVLTKAIAAGAFLLFFIGTVAGLEYSMELLWTSAVLSLIFLALTGALLVKDLDQPKRFLYVLLRPQWKSWLVKGGYFITIFGAGLSSWLLGIFFKITWLENLAFWISMASGFMVAIYTAFLFAQAKGRDFWQSPTLVFHMLAHAFMAGSSILLLAGNFIHLPETWATYLATTLMASILVNLALMFFELSITHPTQDAASVARMIVKGRYANTFWIAVVLLSNVIPFLLIFSGNGLMISASSVLVIVGIYLTEKIWIEAPQRISLT